MSRVMVSLLLLSLAVGARAQNVLVSQHTTVKQNAPPGEAQSAIIPPGTPGCKQGRILVSNDAFRPPADGTVMFRNLSGITSNSISKFDAPPGSPPYEFGSSDHDLIALNNGHVLYTILAFSRRPVPNAKWFDKTFRGTFGPGARSVILTWRSTDCGKTFQFASEIDPAFVEDGSCALPQFRTKADGVTPIETQPWDMGGTDGPLTTHDPVTNRVYVTHICVGYKPDPTKSDFTLDKTRKLNKTLVMMSSNEGADWTSLGFMNDYIEWRMGVVPLDASTLAFGYYDGIAFGRKIPGTDKFAYDDSYTPAAIGTMWWDNVKFPMGDKNSLLTAFVWAHTVTGRTPQTNGVFIVYPDTIDGSHGLRLFFFDRKNNKFAEAEDPILPTGITSASHVVFHPVVVGDGFSPALLYWYDFDQITRKMRVRGRFITGDGQYTDDFNISSTFTIPRTGAPARFYGDYHTAGGGFVKEQVEKPLFTESTFSYYPIWIQPGSDIHFARVDFTLSKSIAPNLEVHAIPPPRWVEKPQPFAVSAVKQPVMMRENLSAHQKQQIKRPRPR